MRTLLKTSIAGCLIMLGMGFVNLYSRAIADSTATAQSSLSGSWKLANMTAGGSPMPMLPVGETPLSAEFSDGQLSGSGGCNRFIGGYETKSGTIKISQIASTFMACEEPIMTQETRFLTALQGAQRYEVDQGQLTIFYENDQGAGVLRFVSQNSGTAQPVQPVQPIEPAQPTQPVQSDQPAQPDQPVRALW